VPYSSSGSGTLRTDCSRAVKSLRCRNSISTGRVSYLLPYLQTCLLHTNPHFFKQVATDSAYVCAAALCGGRMLLPAAQLKPATCNQQTQLDYDCKLHATCICVPGLCVAQSLLPAAPGALPGQWQPHHPAVVD
jgi:hypothetical protein